MVDSVALRPVVSELHFFFRLQKNADARSLKLAQEEFEHCLKQIRVSIKNKTLKRNTSRVDSQPDA